jgi:TRAP transporter TAXI family solute receptor
MKSNAEHQMLPEIRLQAKRWILTLFMIGLFVPAVLGSKEAHAANPLEITIFVTQFGSIGYNHGIAIAEMLNKYNPKFSAKSIETLGMSDAVKQVQDPPYQTAGMAYNGTSNRFPNKQGLPPLKKPVEIKALFVTMETGYTIMTADPKIKTIYDLQGKRMNIGTPAAFTAFAKYLEVLDLKFSKTVRIGHAQGKDAIVDGTLDAAIATLWRAGNKWAPSPAAQELMGQKNGRLVSVPKEAIEKVRKVYPEAWYGEAPPGALGTWQTEPLGYFYQLNGFFVHPKFPEDLAYEIVKTIASHGKDLKNYHASMGAMVDPAFLSSLPSELDFADYHPGAVRYYKEIGAWRRK